MEVAGSVLCVLLLSYAYFNAFVVLLRILFGGLFCRCFVLCCILCYFCCGFFVDLSNRVCNGGSVVYLESLANCWLILFYIA